MTVQVEFWQLLTALIGLLLTFFAFTFATGKVLLSQIDRRLDQRFSSVERAAEDWSRLEKDFLRFQAALPLEYVRREDYVRNQTVLESKIDALAGKFEQLLLQGARS